MSEASPRVRLVVLNHDGGELTLRCLRHLQAVEWPRDALEVVCVDNGSTDGSAERIEAEHPEVVLVRTGANLGFPANNRALGDLDAVDYVGLVNNDAFVEPTYLSPLVAALEADPGLGAVCPKLLLAPRFAEVGLRVAASPGGRGDDRALGVMVRGAEVDGTDVSRDVHVGGGGWGPEIDRDGPFEWTAAEATLRIPVAADAGSATLLLEARRLTDVTIDVGSSRLVATVGAAVTRVTVPLDGRRVDVVNNVGNLVFTDGSGADRGWLEVDRGQYDEPDEVFAWSGGGVLLRPAYLADVGLFDERFFLYYEDTDLAWRGRILGWRYRTAPRSVLRHVHAATSGVGSEVFAYHTERNRLLVLAKCAPRRMAVREALRYVLITASYLRRDVLMALVHGRRPATRTVRLRAGAYAGFLRLLPAMLADRRGLRRRRVVPDAEITTWLVPR